MKQYYVRQILNNYQLEKIYSKIEEANTNNKWHSGLNSLYISEEYSTVKNNLELFDIQIIQFINSIIMNSLDCDKEFFDFTVPSTTDLNIISKTEKGGYYNPHDDLWKNGDFSTTVFLNSPKDYEGGELCLYFGGDEIPIKLDAGWGITYKTGILHRVNKVTSGCRYASVFWTKSLIKDSFIRNIYSELGNLENLVSDFKFQNNSTKCSDSIKDPKFCINTLKNEILRRYC